MDLIMLEAHSAQLVGGFCTLVLAVVGFMIVRAVGQVDTSLTKLSAEVSALKKDQADHRTALAAEDTKILIQLAELRARLVAVEFLVGLKPPVPVAIPMPTPLPPSPSPDPRP